MKSFITKSFDKNSIWFLISNISRLISGFLILGLITTKLDSIFLGTWYLIVSIFSFFSFIELGIYTVLNRWMIHFRQDILDSVSSINLFEKFLNKWWRFYIFLSTFLFLSSVLLGFILFKLNYFKINVSFFVWTIYALGASISILNLFLSSIINSTGNLSIVQKIQTFSVWINVLVLLLLVFSKNNLAIITLGYLLAQIYTFVFFNKSVDINLKKSYFIFQNLYEVFKIFKKDKIWSEIGSTSLGMISSQLLTSAYLIILANHFSPQTIASYGLLQQLSAVVISFSTIWFPSTIYSITAQAKSLDKKIILPSLKKAIVVVMALCIIGFFVLFYAGPEILKFINARTSFPATITSITILLSIILDLFTSLLAQVLVSQSKMVVNSISFINSCVISLASLVALSYFNLRFEYVIFIRILSTFIVATSTYIFILYKYFNNSNSN